MRIALLLLAALVVAPAAFGQRYKLTSINAETPSGKALHAITAEGDATARIGLLEKFTQEHAADEANGWALTELQTAHSKAGNHDKAIATGEKLLALDPTNIEAAYANLKAAEGKKDSEAVAKWAGVTAEIARKVPSLPRRPDQSDEEHKHALDFATQVVAYTEYAVGAAVLSEQDPAKILKLADVLEQRNAKSEYMAMVLPRLASAGRQANAVPTVIAFGERAFERNQTDEDLLALMADHYLQQKDHDKALRYARKIVETLPAKPKPANVADADWEKKTKSVLGLAHWMVGTSYNAQKKFSQADESLRQALPLITGNDALLAAAYFHLSLANYQMAKASKNKTQIADAVAFTKKAAAMKGPYQAVAAKNVEVMAREFGVR